MPDLGALQTCHDEKGKLIFVQASRLAPRAGRSGGAECPHCHKALGESDLAWRLLISPRTDTVQ
ncbi:hypothetical protein ATO13_00825 [Stappia sp. 22II-S9-Z10]|nr:hypothetical protein ATO13_00825 [Stappia sp. 22II-S9-Z10]